MKLVKSDDRKKLSHYIFPKRGRIHSETRNTTTTFGFSHKRLFTRFVFPSRGQAFFFENRVNNSYRNTLTRNYLANPLSKQIRNHAQIAWNKISQRSTPVGKMAKAVSLVLGRSYLVIPGALALTGGNHLLAQSSHDTDPRPSSKTLYTRPEYICFCVTSMLSSAFEGTVLLFRTIYLAILFSPSIVMAQFVDYFGGQFRQVWLQVVRRALERAGPAFIKWGQWAATRPDLFPRDLCKELSKLHSKAPEHSFAYSKMAIEKAFGRKLSEIFNHFEEAPVASGSIAQVHRASLKYRYPGREIKPPMEVAVKVRHPGVGDSIRRDFQIINVVAKFSTFIPTLKWLRLDESVQQFATFMMSQVDLSKEAVNLNRFIYNFRKKRDVSFPKPVYPLVHPAVLLESFEEGKSVAYFVDELKGHTQLKKKLADIGTDAFLDMLFDKKDNLIHGDLHPGNMLVRVDLSKKSSKRLFKPKPHVIFIDVGLIVELSRSDKENLVEFFKSVARRDGQRAAESALCLSKKQNCPNPKAFIQEVKESFDFWGTPEGDLVHPADCMHQLLEQVRRHRVNVEGNICTVLVTVLVLEGWQRKLDPDYDIMHTLQRKLLEPCWAKSLKYTMEAML